MLSSLGPALLVFALAQAPALTLEQALEAANAENLDYKVAQARLEQSNQLSRKAWAGYLPQISVGANYTYNSAEAKITLPFGDMGEIVIQPHNQITGQAQLNQALIAPQLWPAIRNSYLVEKTATLNVENARREILYAVVQVYYGAAALKETIGAQQRLLESYAEHVKDAQARFSLGAETRVALLRAQIEYAKAEQGLRRTQAAFDSSRSALATLLNRDPDFDIVHPASPSDELDAAPLEEKALKDRPDIQAAQVGVELAEGQTTGVWMSYLPSLGFIARYSIGNVAGFTGQNSSWIAGLGLNWTLWDGGLREAQLRESHARERESRAQLQSLQVKAKDEVRRARFDLESARANRVIADEQLRLAKESAELVKGSYEAGAATYLEIIDANSALLGAELAQLTETLNADLAVIKLAKAAGAFEATAR